MEGLVWDRNCISHYTCCKLGEIEKEIPTVINIELRVEPWAFEGLILEFWDSFRTYFVLVNSRSAQNDQKSKICGPMGGNIGQTGILAEGRRNGRGPLSSRIKQLSECGLTRLWHLALRDGGGGSECAQRREHRRRRYWRLMFGAADGNFEIAN